MAIKPDWEFMYSLGTLESLYRVREPRRTRYVTTNGVTEFWHDSEREAQEHYDYTRPGMPGLGD